MDIRTSDADTFVRVTHLIASLDQSKFSDEQREIIQAALEACERVRKQKEYNNERQRKYIAEKRKADRDYGMPSRRKAHEQKGTE